MQFYLAIAVSLPLRQTFTYLPLTTSDYNEYSVGARVEISFGKNARKLIGVIAAISFELPSADYNLKKINSLLDKYSIFSKDVLSLVKFAANYYHHPIGEVYFNSLPKDLKEGRSIVNAHSQIVILKEDKLNIGQALTKLDKKLVLILKNNPQGLSIHTLNCLGFTNSYLKKLSERAWLTLKEAKPTTDLNDHATINILNEPPLVLNDMQKLVLDKILIATSNLTVYRCFLLYGITGSGKTEVYLNLIAQVIKQNKQALILVPEISLTPQTVKRFINRFNVKVAVIHSKISVQDKAQDWLAAKDNSAKIIIGTRSGIFVSTYNLGLIIIDEEHDNSFKQQEGFKYHARDLALVRAKDNNIPIILGSATPSIETVANVMQDKYIKLTLQERAAQARLPKVKLLNIKQQQLKAGLSQELIRVMQETLKKKEQVLIFLNRRGYAPVVKCAKCTWGAVCKRCDVYFTLHKAQNLIICHHCNTKKPIITTCPLCKSKELYNLGVGTEQVEEFVNDYFHDKHKLCGPCIRIDRDTTSKKHALEQQLDKISIDQPQILLGTQMLAKGHHFPNVTLVAILGCDNNLYSTDFRAREKLAQLLVQVSGRAGRSNKPSVVLIQTLTPEHNLLQDILHKDYWQIAEDLYNFRKIAQLPPTISWAVIKAESYNLDKTLAYLDEIKQIYLNLFAKNTAMQIAGPILAAKFKKAGLYRGQLLLSAVQRSILHKHLKGLLQELDKTKITRIKWHLDIDPIDLY